MVRDMSRFAPYAPPATVLKVLRGMRGRELPEALDAAYIGRFDISRALALRVIQALRFLGFVDESRAPTHLLLNAVRGSDHQYRRALADSLRSAYPEIFQGRQVVGESDLAAAFATFIPVSQRYRMVLLFLGLCQEAGIPIQRELRASGQLRLPFPPAAQSRRSRVGSSSGSVLPDALQSGIIRGLIENLPRPGGRFRRRQQAAWLQTMRHALALVYEADDEEPLGKEAG